MKEFSLEEYLKNPQRKIVTREGRNARIICVDRKFKVLDEEYPIMALVESLDSNYERSLSLTCNGKETHSLDRGTDLFFAPIKKEGWVNLYKSSSEYPGLGKIYSSKEVAEAIAKKCDLNPYITTIKIEWEE